MVEKELESLRDSIVNLDFKGADKAAKEALNKAIPPEKVIDSLHAGMTIVGEKFERSEYFLAELVVAGEIAKETMDTIKPYLTMEETESKGKVVLATIHGDIHNIGKNLVGILLAAAGFEVFDLGENVTAEDIVLAVRDHRPQILGLSALLTITMVEMGAVIKELEKSGLRKNLKIIVGGAPITDEFAAKIGANHNAADAIEGVNTCRRWMAERR